MQILIVEDDPVAGAMASQCLERLGHGVLYATDGATGWRTFLNSRPDLLVINLMMPSMTGSELVDRILQQSPHTPILLVSASRHEADPVLARHPAAALRFLAKAALAFDLESAIDEVVADCLRR